MKTSKKYFTLSPRKIEAALIEKNVEINYGGYLFLCFSIPSIASFLPFGTSYEYLSFFFLLDFIFYIIITSIGIIYAFQKETESQLNILKYYICNYPGLYFLVYLVIKPIPYLIIALLYLVGTDAGQKNIIIEKYIESDFLKYAEVITNIFLYIFIFYFLNKKYRRFKLKIATKISLIL